MKIISLLLFGFMVIGMTLSISACDKQILPIKKRTILSETELCDVNGRLAGSPYIFDQTCQRIAYISEQGEKRSLVIDGVAGDEYDEIKIDFGLFSSDGSRYAYIAGEKADESEVEYEWYVNIDGEIGSAFNKVDQVSFSPDSSHVAYFADGNLYLDREKLTVEGGGGFDDASYQFNPATGDLAFIVDIEGSNAVYYNGETGDLYDSIGDIVFSPDGNRLAYSARTEDGWHVVTDGVIGEKFLEVSQIEFSSNGDHVAYSAKLDSGEFAVIVDGSQGAPRTSTILNLAFTPVTNQVVYTYKDRTSSRTDFDFIVIGDEIKIIATGDVQQIQFSTDDESIAYVSSWYLWPEATEYRIFLNEEEIGRHEYIHDFIFVPGTKILAYLFIEGTDQYVAVGDTQGERFDNMISHSAGVSALDQNIHTVIFDSSDTLHYLGKRDGKVYLVTEKYTSTADVE